MQPIIVPDPVKGDNYEAADYLALQARAVGCRPASAGEISNATDAHAGLDGVTFMVNGGVANGTLALVDSSIDWRDRVLACEVSDLTANANRPGASTDYTDWPAPTKARGYTGTGALSNATTGAAVSNGNPPVAGAGVGGRSYRITIGATVYLYADPTSGALYLYNGTFNPVYVWLNIDATADLGLR